MCPILLGEKANLKTPKSGSETPDYVNMTRAERREAIVEQTDKLREEAEELLRKNGRLRRTRNAIRRGLEDLE